MIHTPHFKMVSWWNMWGERFFGSRQLKVAEMSGRALVMVTARILTIWKSFNGEICVATVASLQAYLSRLAMPFLPSIVVHRAGTRLCTLEQLNRIGSPYLRKRAFKLIRITFNQLRTHHDQFKTASLRQGRALRVRAKDMHTSSTANCIPK